MRLAIVWVSALALSCGGIVDATPEPELDPAPRGVAALSDDARCCRGAGEITVESFCGNPGPDTRCAYDAPDAAHQVSCFACDGQAVVYISNLTTETACAIIQHQYDALRAGCR